MRVTTLNQAYTHNPIRDIRGSDLQDGLDISQVHTGNVRVHSSFMKALESLIQFDIFMLTCRQNNNQSLAYDLAPLYYHEEQYFHTFDYFLGLVDARPPKDLMKFNAHFKDVVFDPVDGFGSDPNISADEKNV